MTKPTEITEAMLKQRLAEAMRPMLFRFTATEQAAVLHDAYIAGKFADFVGIVGRMEAFERQRAVNVCNRLGHRQTAAVIKKG